MQKPAANNPTTKEAVVRLLLPNIKIRIAFTIIRHDALFKILNRAERKEAILYCASLL